MAVLRTGAMVTLGTARGESFQAYMAGDEDAPRGMLIFHEWWGLKDHNRDWVDWLSRQGYRCIAPDLFDGRVTDNAEKASHWMQELDQDQTDAKIRATLHLLKQQQRPVATLGYSMGGKQALRAALLEPDLVDAAVVGYCRLETDCDRLALLRAPVLVIYAEQENAWPAKQQAFETAMDAAGKLTESLSFDAAHGFTNPSSGRYNASAAAGAWRSALQFLEARL